MERRNERNESNMNDETIHYVGVAVEPGQKAATIMTKPLRGLIDEIWLKNPGGEWLQESKEDSRLITVGYSMTSEPYHRGYESFRNLSVMLIDCDNTNRDMDIIERFNKRLDGYEFWTYESASSMTQEKPYPRFRGIVPLDREIEWRGGKTMRAIGSLFKEFVDDGASWFYEPTIGKIGTLTHHDGILFPASRVENIVKSYEAQDRFNDAVISQKQTMMNMRYGSEARKVNPMNLPKVKEYLNGSWGEGTDRRPRANSAIYSMVAFDVPPEEIYSVIMDGPASKFRRYLRDSFNGACSKLHKNMRNPF